MIRFYGAGFSNNYLSLSLTQNVKGILTILVFFMHLRRYHPPKSMLYYPLHKLCNLIGQTVVAPFMFYSGYGLYVSIEKRGREYVQSLPKMRIVRVYYHYFNAVIVYIVMNSLLQIRKKPKIIIQTMVGWNSIGNSNWYVFSILSLYCMTYVSFLVCRNNSMFSLLMLFVLCLAYIMLLSQVKKTYWVNTCICYFVGMVYGRHKAIIEKLIAGNNKAFLFVAAASCCLFVSFRHYNDIMLFSFRANGFVLTIILLSMKLDLLVPPLQWLGQHLFWMYILQGLPMITFKQVGLHTYSEHAYACVCFLSTVCLAGLFQRYFQMIEKSLFCQKPLL